MSRRSTVLGLLALLALAGGVAAAPIPFELPLLWPEEQRAFIQDGPALLVADAALAELADRDAIGRERWIADFLADPLPATAANELAIGIERRRDLVRREFLGFLDARAKLLFLHGPPLLRDTIDCTEAFVPMELWTYRQGERPLVLYRPQPGKPWQLWLPYQGKRVLYNPEMEYFLEQWEELKGQIRGGPRIDRMACERAEDVDRVTGVDGLFGFADERPQVADIERWLAPPTDLAAWAAAAAATELAEQPELAVPDLQVFYPDRQGQRMQTRMLLVLPPAARVEPFVQGELRELRLAVEGHLEREGRIFEDFRLRFLVPAPDEPVAIALPFDRLLRPGEEFLVRLRLTDEVSKRTTLVDRGFAVPLLPTPIEEQPVVPDEAIVALAATLQQEGIRGHDSILLIPPAQDVVFGLWRAEALVTGQRIAKVTFLLDGQPVLSRRSPPYTAELRLSAEPREQIVRVEGHDAEGELVGADEVVLNQPHGELRVRIVEPARGRSASGTVPVEVEVVVPEERKIEAVELLVNEDLAVRLETPPWQGSVEVPELEELVYLTAVAILDDGSRAEDVRFLRAPDYVETVDVDLVELYTTVSDRDGRPVQGLERDIFRVLEDGRPQEIIKFERVVDLPLTLGITIDTSGSMYESIGAAQRTAMDFVEQILTPRDRAFAVAFSEKPFLLMGRTSDAGAVAQSLEDLHADGPTALHDAVVTSLYYFRGVRGRRALVLLSDGEDTASSLEFDQALEYARRSGVAIYSIGLRIGRTDVSVRRKLEALSRETGGRTFYISEAEDLAGVYGEIEEELRSQYLIAYSSDQSAESAPEWREVEVEVEGGGLTARTLAGYYP